MRALWQLAALWMLVGCGGGGGGGDDGSGPVPVGSPPPPPQGSVEVSWQMPAEADLMGVRVYFGTAPRTYLQEPGLGLSAGRAPSLVITGLQVGARYYFALTAYDWWGNESPITSEVSAIAR